MEPIKPTFTDHKQRLRIYSGEDADPSRYVIWYEGRDRVIVRKRGESSADLYQRVLEQVQDMRLAGGTGPTLHKAAATPLATP